ncbi:hypothetical protein SAQ01S_07010 [Sphingomonas aquatilis NBRC 16722]|uniref:Secreted protein n=1 Tax=Sphingomonas aquatilis TaxID=93063 RepID=A0AAW3TSC2_9SPHN|nr:hypothetical protein [Sphingomonas aquatilis]MBB3876083.1 hypothetical protein [Sphingomonas aquatilis]GEM70935.1 hypothetical protein SAQ01S_07010 [Sphingomonas aquatilis NBRC 16722]
MSEHKSLTLMVVAASVLLSSCGPSTRPSAQDQLTDAADDAAAEAVAESPKIADLERRVADLEQRDEKIVAYVNAVDRVSAARDRDRKTNIDSIVNYLSNTTEPHSGQP